MLFKNEGGDFQLVPPGEHQARCVYMVDFGTQELTFEGKTEHKERVRIGYEFPNIPLESDPTKCCMIWFEYTKTLDERGNFRKHLLGWRGADFTKEELNGFEAKNILGVPNRINVIHKLNKKGNMDHKIHVIMPPNAETPPQVHDTIYYQIGVEESQFGELTTWVQDRIKKSPEWQREHGVAQHNQDAQSEPIYDPPQAAPPKGEDIPF